MISLCSSVLANSPIILSLIDTNEDSRQNQGRLHCLLFCTIDDIDSRQRQPARNATQHRTRRFTQTYRCCAACLLCHVDGLLWRFSLASTSRSADGLAHHYENHSASAQYNVSYLSGKYYMLSVRRSLGWSSVAVNFWSPQRGIIFGRKGGQRPVSTDCTISTDVQSPSEESMPAAASATEHDCLELPPASKSIFKMVPALFQEAKRAELGATESYWSHRLYRGPVQDEGPARVKVHYCRSTYTAEAVLKKYFAGQKLLGFDLEWKPNAYAYMGIRRNVSLVQLASEDHIALIHLALFPGGKVECPPTLRTILEDPSIRKVGVAIQADSTRFQKFLGCRGRGLLELSHLHRLVKCSEAGQYDLINKRLVSMALMAEEYFHLPLFKGDEVRGGDWSKSILESQMEYAAADAYAGLQLFHAMEMRREALEPCPPCPRNAEEKEPIHIVRRVDPLAEDTSFEVQGAGDAQAKSIPLSPGPDVAEEHVSEAEPSTMSKSPIVATAEFRVTSLRQQKPATRSHTASLRAYYIWYHHAELSLSDIAALLRVPPLKTTTIATYILTAASQEGLPYDEARLRIVVAAVPPAYRARYRLSVI